MIIVTLMSRSVDLMDTPGRTIIPPNSPKITASTVLCLLPTTRTTRKTKRNTTQPPLLFTTQRRSQCQRRRTTGSPKHGHKFNRPQETVQVQAQWHLRLPSRSLPHGQGLIGLLLMPLKTLPQLSQHHPPSHPQATSRMLPMKTPVGFSWERPWPCCIQNDR